MNYLLCSVGALMAVRCRWTTLSQISWRADTAVTAAGGTNTESVSRLVEESLMAVVMQRFYVNSRPREARSCSSINTVLSFLTPMLVISISKWFIVNRWIVF